MTKDQFLSRLKSGLAGLPDKAKAEAMSDYEAHFAEGAAAGRSEADIAAALGDPDRLARELRADAGLKRWETDRNPEAAVAAVFAVLGLGAIDVLVLLPILIPMVCVLCALVIADIAVFIGGAATLAFGPFLHDGADIGAAILAGLGLMAGSLSAGALLTLISIGLVNLLVWYGRLHLRLLRPAI